MEQQNKSMNKHQTTKGTKGVLSLLVMTMLILGMSWNGQAATYFLTSAGASAAQTPGSWNTIAAGGGTAATNFTTTGDIFNIPVGISGVATAAFTLGTNSATIIVLQIDGQLTINAGVVITLSQKNAGTVAVTVNGTIIFSDPGANQIIGLTSGGGSAASNTFTLANSATLKTVNTNGISSSPITSTTSINTTGMTLSLNAGANYEFNGSPQSTTGLPATVANLTLSGSGAKTLTTTTTSITGNLTLSGTASTALVVGLTIGGILNVGTGSTLNLSTFTLTLSGTGTPLVTTGTFTPSTGTVIYTGSTAQTITGTTIFNNLTVNNAAGLTLASSSNTTINGTLTLTNGILTIGNNTLTLGGAFSGSTTNSLKGSQNSDIVCSGTTGILFFDQSNPETTNVVKNLTLLVSATATLGNALNIEGGNNAGTVTVATGATLTTVGFLTLKSLTNGTASIGTSAGTISGNVKVERFISGNSRRWRFLTSPISGKTIADWMTQFYVTGPGTAGSSLGDPNSNGWHTNQANINNATVTTTSIRTYNEATAGDLNLGWTNLSGTSQALTPGQGFRAFIRGAFGTPSQLDGTSSSSSPFTIFLTGTVNQSDISMPVSSTFLGSWDPLNDGWNLLGNPYPCAYDWNSASTVKTNIDANIYVFDATSNGYKSYNASSGGSLTNGIIPIGAAFFIQTTGTGAALTFKEAGKTTTAPIAVHKGAKSDEFAIKYSKDSLESDEFIIKMIDGSTPNRESFDIPKLKNENLNLSSYGDDTIQLTLSCIPPVTAETRIKLNVEATEIGIYKFEFTNMDNFDAGVSVSLFDNYTKTTTDVKKNTKYTFDMGAGVNQWGKNRFELILNGKAATGVNENTNNITNTQVAVYPNPATDVLNINISNASFKNSNVRITNVSGKEIMNTNMNGTNTQINIEGLSNGIYFVNITNENGFNKTVKFVK